MPERSVARQPADAEFLALPVRIRLELEEILPALIRHPFRSGPGYTVSPIGNHPGLWKLKLTDFPPRAFRAVFEVDGDVVRFLAFGPRPEFYQKLQQKDRKGQGRPETEL